MTADAFYRITALPAVLALSACGGGGGAEGSLYMQPGVTGDTVLSEDNAEIYYSGTSSDPSALTMAVGGRIFEFDESSGATLTQSGGFIRAVAADGTNGWFDLRRPGVVNGRVRTTTAQDGPFNDDLFYVGVSGYRTEAMPTGRVAFYRGQSLGYLYTPSADQIKTTRSDVQMTVLFDDREMSFVSDNGVTFHPDTGTRSTNSLDLSGVLAIEGGRFSGALSGPGDTGEIGMVTGHFYGPDAESAGGVFSYDYGTYAGAASFSAGDLAIPD